jgi:hypothetical protein
VNVAHHDHRLRACSTHGRCLLEDLGRARRHHRQADDIRPHPLNLARRTSWAAAADERIVNRDLAAELPQTRG